MSSAPLPLIFPARLAATVPGSSGGQAAEEVRGEVQGDVPEAGRQVHQDGLPEKGEGGGLGPRAALRTVDGRIDRGGCCCRPSAFGTPCWFARATVPEFTSKQSLELMTDNNIRREYDVRRRSEAQHRDIARWLLVFRNSS